MAIIRFSWDNLIWRSSTVFDGGTVDADWPLANLAEYHPSKKTRLTDMTDSYVRANFVPPEIFDVVAVLNHNASPHRNLLQYSGAVSENPTEWVEANVVIGETGVTDASVPARIEKFTNTGSGAQTHWVFNTRVLASYTTDRGTAGAGQAFVYECYLKQAAADQHVRMRVTGSSGAVTAHVNLNTGATDSEAVSGNFSALTTTITSVGGFYKVVMQFTVAKAETSLQTVLLALSSGFGTPFDSTAVWFYFAAPSLYLGSSSERYDQTLAGESGALWRVKRVTGSAITPTSSGLGDDTGWLNMAQSSNPKPLSDALGTLSAYTVLNQGSAEYLLIELHDPDNVATDIDIGALWAGRSWQPAIGSLQPGWRLFVDEDTGMLNLSGTILYLNAADYYEDAIPLALNARVGAQAKQLSIGGQEFWSDAKPVVVIVDDTETVHGQQQMVYGFLEKWNLHHFSGPDQFTIDFLVRGLRA